MSETLHLTPHEHVTVVEHSAERLIVEVSYDPDGSAPPLHLHPEQDERFEVLEGELTTRVDGEERVLRPGDVLEIPRAKKHQMWNAGAAPVRARWETAPAGRTLEWFRAIDAAGRKPAGLRQAALVAALAKYRDVFRLSR